MFDIDVLLNRLDQLEATVAAYDAKTAEQEVKFKGLEAKVVEQEVKVAEHEAMVSLVSSRTRSQSSRT